MIKTSLHFKKKLAIVLISKLLDFGESDKSIVHAHRSITYDTENYNVNGPTSS